MPDQRRLPPDYTTADRSLWFVVAVHGALAAGRCAEPVACRLPPAACRLPAAVDTILDGHASGSRFGIAMDEDGLLRAGEAERQLTWMDAKIGDWVVTPRIGKPAEIQALWYNALRIAAAWNQRWGDMAGRARDSFLRRFADPVSGGLVDVVDADHVAGSNDASLRPNQIFAVGGLPFDLVAGNAAARIVQCVEDDLLSPLGLRTLSPRASCLLPALWRIPTRPRRRLHQGTVWPWLMGPFVQAWLRVNGDTAAARAEARGRFLPPLLAHLDEAGLGHVSEVADGDAPHRPGGCPFQAWSMGELIRVRAMVAAPE